MLDKNKIRLMARLAIYDKEFGAVDRRKNNYYKWDYVYFRNFWTRLGVFLGCMIISLFYVLKKLLIEEADLFVLDLKAEAAKIGFYTLLALVFYTIIGTLVANNEYKKSKKRLEAYFTMLERLGAMDGQTVKEAPKSREPEEYRYRAYEDGRGFAGIASDEPEESEPYSRIRRREDAPPYGGAEYGKNAQPRPRERYIPGSDDETTPRRFSYGEGNSDGEKGIDILKRMRGEKNE